MINASIVYASVAIKNVASKAANVTTRNIANINAATANGHFKTFCNIADTIITAIGNDYGYDKIFARQLQAQGVAGDVFIGISTSGNSKNIVDALPICKEKGITTIALTGMKSCKMDDFDIVIKVPS